MWRDSVFHSLFKNYFSCSGIIFVGLGESHEISESGTFRVMYIPKKPQAAMPSSLKIELRSISPFHLPHLRRSLIQLLSNPLIHELLL